MKVLQINAVYGFSSTGRTTAEIDEALKLAGIKSLVATTETSIKRDDIYLVGTVLERKIHALLSRVMGMQGYFSRFATYRLIKRIKKENPDVIHLRNLHANYINMPVLFKHIKKNDIATVVTLHDCWTFTGKCTHYHECGCYKWIDGCHNCPLLKKDNVSWFFDRTKKMWQDKKKWFSDIPRLAVIGVSDWITNEAKKSFLKDGKIVKRIYNWIDLNVFYPRNADLYEKYGISKDKFLILCISAGWTEDSPKYKDLCKLSSMLAENEVILLAGKTEEGLHLPQNIIPIGYINGVNDLAQMYSFADVYVHLSREDTFGKVIAEAMACGTPAVVYNSTACPELIGPGCGYVVEKGDVDGVYSAITNINKHGKQAYMDSCVSFAKNNFDKQALIEEMTAVYYELSGVDQ